MKRKTRRTRQQLALVLQSESRIIWPAETRNALIAALADLLLEALSREQDPLLAGGQDDESEDQR